MEIVADQDVDSGRDEGDVVRRNVARNIEYALWQCQPDEIRENTGERLRPGKAHEPHPRHSQQGLDDRGIRRTGDPYGIDLAVLQRGDRGGPRVRQKRRSHGRDAVGGEDSVGDQPNAASGRPDGDAFAFELRQAVKRFVRRVKNPKRGIIDNPQRQQPGRLFAVGNTP